jgi:hypothetical protein
MKWNRTDPEPDPEQLAAWADGELDRADAERVESWLARHSDTDEPGRLVRLYRDHPPPEPSEHAWQAALTNIADRAMKPAAAAAAMPRSLSFPRWRSRVLLALAASAAVLGGVLLARSFWSEHPDKPKGPQIAKLESTQHEQLPLPGDDTSEPFPVATLGEVEIISVSAEDADRVMMGQPLLGTFEVAAPDDVQIVKMEPRPDDGQTPSFHRGQEVPMILAAAEHDAP